MEGLNRQSRQVTKNKPSPVNDEGIKKMLYLPTQKIVKRWTVRCRNWDVLYDGIICNRAFLFTPAAKEYNFISLNSKGFLYKKNKEFRVNVLLLWQRKNARFFFVLVCSLLIRFTFHWTALVFCKIKWLTPDKIRGAFFHKGGYAFFMVVRLHTKRL